jgi:hypothetical protein
MRSVAALFDVECGHNAKSTTSSAEQARNKREGAFVFTEERYESPEKCIVLHK